ncbi:hypothetical protein QO004_004777 [Rhizobium mesoamericanum]|nr:hypothetical protein [Rhizobium mesoamericanum]
MYSLIVSASIRISKPGSPTCFTASPLNPAHIDDLALELEERVAGGAHARGLKMPATSPQRGPQMTPKNSQPSAFAGLRRLSITHIVGAFRWRCQMRCH